MSFTPFKETTGNNAGSTAKYGSNDLKEVMQILNGTTVSGRRPQIGNPWIWINFFDVKPPVSAPAAPSDANTSRFYVDPSDFKVKVRKTGGTILDIENINIPDSALSQITDKAKLPSSTVFNNQSNIYQDFDQTFRSARFRIGNPAFTFSYSLVGSAITADRNLTIPLLTGNDVLVTEAHTQTISNKTYNIDQNTFKHSTTNNAGDLLKGNGTQFNRFARGSALQVLRVNSGATDLEWADPAAGASTLDGLTDVVITSAADNQVLTFDSGSGNWRNEAPASGGGNVSTTQANTYDDFDQIFRSGRLILRDSDNTHSYLFKGSNLAANRDVTLPLLTANDIFVMEAFAQTLTNKTIAAGSNTISGIVDANIDAHTSTKVTITAKGQLNSSIVYEDEANTFGDFDNAFRSSRLIVRDSDNSHGYLFAGSNLTANRTVTLPLLTGNDVFVMEAFAQTLTNKTIAAGSNTISGIADSQISAHTTTKITTTSKSLLNSALVYNDQANTFGAFDQIFPHQRLLLGDSNASHNYIFAGSDITANRTVTLPLLTGNDTFVMAAFAQTLTNKTINAADNTITDTSQATGDILANNGSKFIRKARGTALQVLRTNSGATDIEWASLDSERVGKSTASANGSTAVFNIAHGLGSTPTYAFISVAQSGSAFIGYQYTVDATNIVVTFASNPASGTNNVIIYWRVVA